MLANLFYRNPRLTSLAIGLVIVAGLAALQSLPRQEDPTLARRFGSITTRLPGASAQRVEALVTDKIEAELLEMAEIGELDSLSRAGISVIRVDLLEEIEESEVDVIWSRMRDRLGDVAPQLPASASAPDLEDLTSVATTLVVGVVWKRDGAPQRDLMGRLAEELESRLQNLPGTRETDLYGEPSEEIRVSVASAALAAANLTPADVSAAIARGDAKVPAGQLRHGRNDLLIEVAGELDSLERIRSIPVRQEADGRLLRVGDLASVTRTVRQPPASLAYAGERPAVVVSATMEPGRRVDLWAAEARATVAAMAEEMPAGIVLDTLFDQSHYTEERLGSLAWNLGFGAALVIAVLFFTMGARSALLVGAALPLTLLAVLAELNLLGVPLHQTSVTGLIIALGLLIDNAIVVVDEYNEQLHSGLLPGEAVARAVQHLFVPLLASTLTTVLAFLPIVLMPGGAGEFVGPISIGVGLSVVTSFVVSLTVIPALAGYVTSRTRAPGNGPWWKDGFTSARLARPYRRSLDAVIRRPWLGVAVSAVLPLLGFLLSTTMTMQFFPPNDRNQFQVQLVLPSQTSVEETARTARRARELVDAHDDVLESHWFVGESTPRVFYNMFGLQDGISSFAGAFVTTRGPAATESLLPRLQAEMREQLPEALAIALPFEQGPPFDAPIEVILVGPELDRLRELGDEVRAILAETAGVTYTRAQLLGGEPKLLVRADEAEAQSAGLRLVDIAEQLDARLEGDVGGSLLEATEEIPVRVRVEDASRRDLARIASDSLLAPGRSRDGSARIVGGVPLSALARVELVPELAGISRRFGERSNTVQAYLEPYALIAESEADFERRLEASGFQVPTGYRLERGGESEERGEALSQLASFALPMLVMMFGSIILAFDSYRYAAVIFVVAGLSIGLALLGVWLFGHPLGFLAIVGTMGLVGLAINGAIVVLSALRADLAAREGDPDAIREVVVIATRHIVATTLTTVCGFLPLILLGGRFWPPLATAIAGGVGGAAILALYLVPSLFTAVARQEAARAGRLPVRPSAHA